MQQRNRCAVLLASVAILSGCGIDPGGTGEDQFVTDSGDDGSTDTVIISGDTTVVDSGVPDDTTVLDSGGGDTSVVDSGGGDTTVVDSGGTDTTVVDSGGTDTTVADTTDSAVPPDTTLPPDTADACVESACGALPSGAKRMALVDRTVACPAGFTSTDVVEAKPGDACACSAALTSPTCPGKGSIATWYSGGAGCGSSGTTITSSGTGACMGLGGTLSNYFKATPPGPTGGGCPTTVTPDKTVVSSAKRLCEATACAGAICGTSPFLECVEGGGACGGAFPNAHTIGTDLSVTCPACSSALTSGTCTGTLDFYTGSGCTGTMTAYPVDGTCVAVTGSKSVATFTYTPSAVTGASCGAPTYTKAPGTPVFTGTRNLCCR
jgi:hypothetical protein